VQEIVQLIRGIDGVPVDAYLVDLAQKHASDFDNFWREQLRLYGQEDKFWDWLFKLRFIANQENREGYAIECFNQTEGLMMIETAQHGSRITPGKRIVYVDGIASAPWNRKAIQRPQKFKGVGTALLEFARNRSIELGYEGRVGLHCLPGAEGFYEHQGMLDLGSDEDYEDLIYFEFGPWRINK
jgi:GNAT superfamily N-acetyltransferase